MRGTSRIRWLPCASGLERGALLLGNADRDGHVREDDHVVQGEYGQELGAWLGHALLIPRNRHAYAFPSR